MSPTRHDPPATLRHRLARAAVGAALLLSPALTGFAGAVGPSPSLAVGVAHADSLPSLGAAPGEAVASLEQQFFDLLNNDRVASGLAPLSYDPALSTVARWRSEDMATRTYFSHDIGGYMVFSVLKEQGISYRVAGENLAFNYQSADRTAPAAETALMNSPTHRDNILRPDFTHAGVGIAVAPDGRVLFTQLFKKAW
jgi:uncharacterized protein YkwD